MAKTYGDDFRGLVIAAVDGGMSRSAAAARFEVGKATAIAWEQELPDVADRRQA